MKLHSRAAGHFYTEKKLLYPSVTTILGTVPNPELDAWKARTQNWRKITGVACKFGTEVHNEIEDVLTLKRFRIEHKIQVEAFLAWHRLTGFRCIKTEIKVRSNRGFGGSLDLLGKIGNDLFIIDLKTSKRIYPNFLLQVAAYKYAFMEMWNIPSVNIGILRLEKMKVPKKGVNYTDDELVEKFIEWVPYTDDEYEKGIQEFLELCDEWHKNHKTVDEFNKKFILED